MQSLNSDRPVLTSPEVLELSGDREVLPKFLRRPARFIGQLSLERLARSNTFKMFVAGAFVLGAGGFLMAERSDLRQHMASATTTAGFKVNNFVLNGSDQVDSEVVKMHIGPSLQGDLFDLDVEEAREAIARNSWIESATVRKVFPDTLVVDIVERKPVALWKSNDRIFLVSRDGIIIDEAREEHSVLPQVVGEGTNLAASDMLSTLARFPMINSRVAAYVRVADRRWNLNMRDGTKILLPEQDWKSSIASLYDLQARLEILDRDLIQLDMRLPDRLVVRLRPDVAQIRKAAIEKALSEVVGHKI